MKNSGRKEQFPGKALVKARRAPRMPTLSQQWKSVTESAQQLAQETREKIGPLNLAWQVMDQVLGLKTVGRGEALSTLSESPLQALFLLIEAGFYPPPELLLSLKQTWDIYLSVGRDGDFERAFLGAPRPKTGCYANRHRLKTHTFWTLAQFERHIAEGKSRLEAAEEVRVELAAVGRKVDIDSVLRMVRTYRTQKKKKAD